MRFLLDTQLSFKLKAVVRAAGYPATHTTDIPQGHLLDDEAIIKMAVAGDQIIMTKDLDFYNYYVLKGAHPRLLHLTFGNISNSELTTYLKAYLSEIAELFLQGSEVIEFGRAGYRDRTLNFPEHK